LQGYFVFAGKQYFTVAEAGAVGVVVAVAMAGFISASLGAHLRQLNAVAVFILSPGSGATHAAGLEIVGVRVHLEFSAAATGSAAAMSFHRSTSQAGQIARASITAAA
jgi:hypothetical protein